MQDLRNAIRSLRTYPTTHGSIHQLGKHDIGNVLILFGKSSPDMFLYDQL
jgi:hypothetical protein